MGLKITFAILLSIFVNGAKSQTFLTSFFNDSTWSYTNTDTLWHDKNNYEVKYYDNTRAKLTPKSLDSTYAGSNTIYKSYLASKQRWFKSGFAYAISYHENGLPISASIGDIASDPTFIYFHKNGKISFIGHATYDKILNSVYHGLCIEYDENGKIVKTEIYDHGRPVFCEPK